MRHLGAMATYTKPEMDLVNLIKLSLGKERLVELECCADGLRVILFLLEELDHLESVSNVGDL